jgi:hypothetical protein
MANAQDSSGIYTQEIINDKIIELAPTETPFKMYGIKKSN